MWLKEVTSKCSRHVFKRKYRWETQRNGAPCKREFSIQSHLLIISFWLDTCLILTLKISHLLRVDHLIIFAIPASVSLIEKAMVCQVAHVCHNGATYSCVFVRSERRTTKPRKIQPYFAHNPLFKIELRLVTACGSSFLRSLIRRCQIVQCSCITSWFLEPVCFCNETVS